MSRPADRRHRLTPYVFIGPAALLFAAFSLIPIVIAITLSFQDTQPLGEGQWVGVDNFAQLGSDRLFRTALVNTLVFTIGTVPTAMAAGLALAVALNRPCRAGACCGRCSSSRWSPPASWSG